MIDRKQWRRLIGSRAIDYNVVKIQSWGYSLKVKRETARLHVRSYSGCGFLLGSMQNESVETLIVKQHVNANDRNNDKKNEDAGDPGGDFLPARALRLLRPRHLFRAVIRR